MKFGFNAGAGVVIPIVAESTRSRPIVPLVDEVDSATSGPVRDAFDRGLHDLRISVTDRCNFRCTYCMPKDVFDREHAFLPHSQLLTFEEITTLATEFVALGVEKIRLTGGEPLLRKDVERLVELLARLRTTDGQAVDLTMTTNGSLLRRKAEALRRAGLKRLTVSLDALDDTRFRAMNDVDFPVAAVLDGIDAAAAAGFGSIKVNMVVKRGVNDDQVEAMARRFRGTAHVLRFIEFMDVGTSNRWIADAVVPSAELAERLDRLFPIEPLAPNYRGEVAERWRYRDGGGEIGFISSVTQPFCRACSRARLSPEGRLYTCLFASDGADLRPLLRTVNADDDAARASRAREAIASVWRRRTDRYSELRGRPETMRGDKVEMSYIGG